MVAYASPHVASVFGEAVRPVVGRPRVPATRTGVFAVCHESDEGIVPPFRLSHVSSIKHNPHETGKQIAFIGALVFCLGLFLDFVGLTHGTSGSITFGTLESGLLLYELGFGVMAEVFSD